MRNRAVSQIMIIMTKRLTGKVIWESKEAE